MGERDISRADVKNCICNGEIIEDYLEDFPHPSCLVFGYTVNNRILHVVAGTNGRELFIITTYFPNPDKFESDMKTREGKVMCMFCKCDTVTSSFAAHVVNYNGTIIVIKNVRTE